MLLSSFCTIIRIMAAALLSNCNTLFLEPLNNEIMRCHRALCPAFGNVDIFAGLIGLVEDLGE